MLAMTLMYSGLAIIIFICRALFWENQKQLLAFASFITTRNVDSIYASLLPTTI